MKRFDYQRQQEQDERMRQAERDWLKVWRDTWAAWARAINQRNQNEH